MASGNILCGVGGVMCMTESTRIVWSAYRLVSLTMRLLDKVAL